MDVCIVVTATAKMTRRMVHLATVRGGDDKASIVGCCTTGYGCYDLLRT